MNFQKSMGHEGSNDKASVNVRRDGCAFRLNKYVRLLTLTIEGVVK